MSDAQIFDPTSYLLEEHQSPGLQPIEPTFEVKETPPPIATRDSSREPSSEDEEEEGHGENERPQESSEGQPKVNDVHSPASKPDLKSSAPAPNLPPTKRTLNLLPPPIQTRLQPEDSIQEWPALARFTINRDGELSNSLPAMQMSPLRSSSKDYPEMKQTLPSLTTTLSDAGAPFSAHSPNLTHAGQMYGPLPQSAMSPPSLHSHPSCGRTNPGEGSISTPSNYAVVSASGSVLTPTSSIANQSPAASHPTPTTTSPETRPDRSAEQVLSIESDNQETNGIGGPFSTNSYPCTFPECTAAPFQTQYLLNSHMNVHSEKRPHYCPVKGCARGPGGQGFKRKNEMIRHGLVHTSPGYMCPYCPDQQSKYPRPDNLQRHVRVNHVDKDRDESLLREVLAQRPEGDSRGRRRRLGS